MRNRPLGLHTAKINGMEITFYGTSMNIVSPSMVPDHWEKHVGEFVGEMHTSGDRIYNILWTCWKLGLARQVHGEEMWTKGYIDAKGNHIDPDIEGRKITVWT